MQNSKFKKGQVVYNLNNNKQLVKITNIEKRDNSYVYTYEYGLHFCSEGFASEYNLEFYNGPKINELWLGL